MYLSTDTMPQNIPDVKSSGFDWAGLANTIPSLFDSIAGLFGKKVESKSLYDSLGPTPPKRSNTIYYIVGGVLVITIVGTIIALNRRGRVSSRT